MCPPDLHLHGINYLSWIGYVRWNWHEWTGVWLSTKTAEAVFHYYMCGGR